MKRKFPESELIINADLFLIQRSVKLEVANSIQLREVIKERESHVFHMASVLKILTLL